MVGTEGADWKRHRAVAKPAFNEVSHKNQLNTRNVDLPLVIFPLNFFFETGEQRTCMVRDYPHR